MVWSRLLVPIGLAAATVLPMSGVSAAAMDRHDARPRVAYRQWTSRADFASGRFEGTRLVGHALTIARPIGRTTYDDPYGGGEQAWEYARWTSPPQRVGFPARELVASWTAWTPRHSWLRVEMRGRTEKGTRTKWYVMGLWSADDPGEGGAIHRTSVPGQADADGDIAIDTFKAAGGHRLERYQLRVTLYRRPGGHARPVVRSIGAMTSLLPDRETVPVSPLGGAEGIELTVPRYSQEVHSGEYPEYDGGGEAWCSPTSTSMVVAYWHRGPSRRDMSWVDPSYQDPQVDYAARNTYDYNYEGAGNWPFNTAYAGRFGLDGFVTRLRSLTELERFIKAGIPVVTSQSFDADELPGAGYSTNGHLFVVVGFTDDGDPIVNDPASPSDAAVRHVYPRAAFENVWQRSSSSGGIAYIIHPKGHRLPPNVPGLAHNW